MKDPRLKKLAEVIVRHSVSVKPGEKILIQARAVPHSSAILPFIEEIYHAGGQVFVEIIDPMIQRKIRMHASEEQFLASAKYDLVRMQEMDGVIIILGEQNTSEFSDIPIEQQHLYMKAYEPVFNHRVNKTKWCLVNYPTPAYAQLANMSTEAYEDFFYEVCTIDYSKMSKAMDALVELMNQTDRVRIVAPHTDISFSIKGIPAIKCDGKVNIPDGEVYTAPVKESVNGKISFNTSMIYLGETFENVVLEFQNGKIVHATSNKTKRMNEIFDTDEGSRFLGEFAFGINPYIHHPVLDVGFDEKIHGSIHMAVGSAYEESADNGNRSKIHWDMVLILRPEYGGGEVYFDDVLISKDGKFVVDSLIGLNPENLIK